MEEGTVPRSRSAYIRERIAELMEKLAATQVTPHVLGGTASDLSAGPNVVTTIPETSLSLDGAFGPAVLRAMEWFSNTARNTSPGTINHNERRKVRLEVINVSDDEVINRTPLLAAVFFRYDSARWDCPCPYVVAPKAQFRVVLTDDGITAGQGVWVTIHLDTYCGMSREDLQEAASLGLLDGPSPLLAVLDDLDSDTLDLVDKVRRARRVPFLAGSLRTDTPASVQGTSMVLDDLRLPGRGAYLLKAVRFFCDAATRDETAGDDAAVTTFTTSNNMLDRIDAMLMDFSCKREFSDDAAPPGLLGRWSTAEWRLKRPYVVGSDGPFRVKINEALGVATTDCYVVFDGYSVAGLSESDAKGAIARGLLR
jgi:hypothetical protein